MLCQGVSVIPATCSSVIDRTGGAHSTPSSCSPSEGDTFKEKRTLLLLLLLNEVHPPRAYPHTFTSSSAPRLSLKPRSPSITSLVPARGAWLPPASETFPATENTRCRGGVLGQNVPDQPAMRAGGKKKPALCFYLCFSIANELVWLSAFRVDDTSKNLVL